MNNRIDEEGMFQGSNIRISKQWPSPNTTVPRYLVIAEDHIELETTSLDMANGIAAALQATVREGSQYNEERALWVLARLIEARKLLAAIVLSEAKTFGGVSERMAALAERLYGERNG